MQLEGGGARCYGACGGEGYVVAMGVEVLGPSDEKRVRRLDLAQVEGLVGGTEHRICRPVVGGGAGFD